VASFLQLHSVLLRSHHLRNLVFCLALLLVVNRGSAQMPTQPSARPVVQPPTPTQPSTQAPAPPQQLPLVNLKTLDPTIVVDLRYGSRNNIFGEPLYGANMPALLRSGVAGQVAKAQADLRSKGFGLKIWDAYRPKAAHERLWQYWPDTDYLASPQEGGSLHTRGVAVDATLVDAKGRDVKMPTDFDDFTPAAMLRYTGKDQLVRRHLSLLQWAMARAGFYGLRTEWWHFVSKEWQSYPEGDAGAPPPPPPLTSNGRPRGGPVGAGMLRTR
jgi:D-alanyl-D-alanine dipeptidase